MNNIIKLLNIRTVSHQTSRAASRNAYNWRDEGVQYAGLKHYPRTEDREDAPCEPSKLFRVQRIARLKGVSHFEKKILREFKLDGRQSEIAIVKNIPENNARLWKIKHLVKISPVTFPNGFPKDATGTALSENGELVVAPRLIPDERKLVACDSFLRDVKKLDGDTLRRELRKRWLSGW